MSTTDRTKRSRSTSASGDSPFGPASRDPDQWSRYERRMRRVIEHVYDNLDEPLDLHAVADVACLSPYHWHRVYHALYGETLADTVRRLRLHRAAGRLANTDRPIGRIAADVGYANVQSFTRAFKAEFGLPPARYRETGHHRAFVLDAADHEAADHDVVVERLEALPVLALDHRGSYMGIGRSFDLLFTRLAAADLVRPGMRMLAQYFDDPALVPEHELRSRAAVTGAGQLENDIDLVRTTIAGGLYGVLEYVGPYASMHAAYRWLYGVWLPASDYEPADAPVVEEYLNSPRDTPPEALRTLICLPLAEPASKA